MPAVEGELGAFRCQVTQVIQDVFSTIVLLRPAHAEPDAPFLRMELDRDAWRRLNADEWMWITVQPHDLLLLR